MSKESAKTKTKLHLAFVIDYMGEGGVETFLITIIESLLKRDYRIDLVLFEFRGPRLQQIPDGVNLFVLDKHFDCSQAAEQSSVPVTQIRKIGNLTGFWKTCNALIRYFLTLRIGKIAWLPPRGRDFKNVCSMSDYLKTTQPDLIWAHTDPCLFASVLGRKMSSVKVPVAWSIHNEPSYKGKKRLYLNPMLRECAGVHAISHGVARSLIRIIPAFPDLVSKVFVIDYPFDTARISSLAQKPTDHKWLALDQSAGKCPKLVIAASQLIKRKNIELLIRAFSSVLRMTDARLIILGEGDRRGVLESLARELKVDHAISMPGFVENPYPFMAKADLFVMSSNTEGFGRVLMEALICGSPVVSTDCKSGPREVLEDGRWGRLVPVDDEAALTGAILESLGEDADRNALKARGMSFDVDAVTFGYEDFIFRIVNQNRPGN